MTSRPGRNDPCPCGSGKKFKKCCIARMSTSLPSGDHDHEHDDHHHHHRGPGCSHHDARVDGARPYRQLDDDPRHPGGPKLSAYTLAKITEDPRSVATLSPEIKAEYKRHMRVGWTTQRVAGMSTDAIEAQLRTYGVEHSCERFLKLAEGTFAASPISEIWRTSDPITCKGLEEDFLLLAACELWKKYIPDRPSIEMIDDWMQEGYDYLERDDVRASDIWWKVWRTLLPRFTRSMRCTEDTADVFDGSQAIFNWCQDFETALHNAALRDTKYAEIGIQFVTEFLAQFPDESELLLVNMNRALAGFLLELGRTAEGFALLQQTIDRWPTNVWGYVALADVYSGIGRTGTPIPNDVPKAISILEAGLDAASRGDPDVEVLRERLEELRRGMDSKDATPPTGPGP